MILIYGRRTARIKKYTENHQACKSCKTFDLNVKVYRDYYHIFFIPIFPAGLKSVKIICNNCKEPNGLQSLHRHYENISRTPIYLYTLPIVFVCLFVFLINANLNKQKEKSFFVENPQVGDIYLIRNENNNKPSYYFLRLIRINGDTVVAYHSNLEYSSFVYKLNDEDFFVRNEDLYFLKPELREMLERNEINSVERVYDDAEGFNRIK
jgi:hypothetical protein